MQHLTRDGWYRAVALVEAHAAPLDRALGRHFLFGGDRQEAIDALAALQNPDGGFSGMEADFSEDSSAVVSTIRALQILEELAVAADHPMAARAIDGLAADYVPAWRSWRLIRQHDNTRPHAPWWHWTDDFDERWGYYADNPRPAVVACLHAFSAGVDAALLAELTGAVIRRARELDPAGVHNNATECYHRFACSPAVPAAAREAVAERLTKIIDATLITEPARWRKYGLQPLDIADGPASPFYDRYRDHVERHLDYLVDTQGPDGAWAPHWSWAGTFPEAWERASVSWKGRLTVVRLRQLVAFGRVAER